MDKKELVKDFLRNHTAELVVMAIGLAISFVIAGGNLDVLAASRRGR